MAESENAAHFSEISREEILTKAQLGGLTLQSGVDRGVHFTILEGASKEGRGKPCPYGFNRSLGLCCINGAL